MSDWEKSYQELVDFRLTLQDQLFKQTAAMFKYCRNAGIAFPENMYQEFDHIFQQWIQSRKKNNNQPDWTQSIAASEDKTASFDQNQQGNGVKPALGSCYFSLSVKGRIDPIPFHKFIQ